MQVIWPALYPALTRLCSGTTNHLCQLSLPPTEQYTVGQLAATTVATSLKDSGSNS
jgi:hypothetical protein